ncbi:MAG: hypothetical protein AAGG01_05505 [Planctomycetota bacterium]
MSHSPRPPRASLTEVLGPLLAGTGIFGGALVMAIGQAARSNRPHELTLAPVVTLIQAGAVWLIGLGALRLVRMLRARHETPVSGWHWLLVVPVLGAASLLFLLGAGSTAIEVLQS